MRVSTGQAAANALAEYLHGVLGPDVVVKSRWPSSGKRLPLKAVTIVPVGRRQRVDVQQDTRVLVQEDLQTPPGGAAQPTAQISVRIGSYVQPMQLDVWCQTYTDRDDLIDRLDDALTQGEEATLISTETGLPLVTSDPWRDGILLQLLPADGYTGIAELLFDEPEVSDDAESIQRSEFRATYIGEARGDFARTRIVPRMTEIIEAVQTYTSPVAPPGATVPYATSTLTLNPTPPPTVTVTRGSNSTP